MDYKEQLIRELDKLSPLEVHRISAAAAAPIGGRKMTKYHAVMLDETRCEFGVSVEAESRSEALAILREDYCESRCVQLESPEDTEEREQAMYERMEAEYNGEFFHDEEDY